MLRHLRCHTRQERRTDDATIYHLPVKAPDPDPESLAIGAAIDAAFAAGRASVLGTPSSLPV